MSDIQAGRLRASNDHARAALERAAENMPKVEKIDLPRFRKLDTWQRTVLKQADPDRYAELVEEDTNR